VTFPITNPTNPVIPPDPVLNPQKESSQVSVEFVQDVLTELFAYLNNADMVRAFLVCRKWAGIEKDRVLRIQMVRNFAFGKRDWERFYGQVGEEPLLKESVYKALVSQCLFWPDKKVSDTHLLVLIPETVDGKPLTLDSLGEMIKHPRQGPATKYSYYSAAVKKEFGGVARPSHWALMTRDVIPESRNQTYADQCDLVASHAKEKNLPLELPLALDAAASILMHHVKTGDPLFTDDKLGKEFTHTRCQEKVDGNQWPAAIGGFSAEGILASNDCHARGISVGVAVFWKF